MRSDIEVFRRKILHFYKKNGRHTLPWRLSACDAQAGKTSNPYRVLVSEIMLQQTQVDRVVPKYREFLKVFPTVRALARAPLRDVLKLWSGLGYNRRAKMLHDAAGCITHEYNGRFPKSQAMLLALPGVGPYTASAVATFAYNQPVVMIETNIRSVFIHEFFDDRTDVADSELLPLIQESLDIKNPRQWYAALMDYGTHIKKTQKNPSRKSKSHTTQSKFKGSLREVRGRVVAALIKKSMTNEKLAQITGFTRTRTSEALSGLAFDGLVKKNKLKWQVS